MRKAILMFISLSAIYLSEDGLKCVKTSDRWNIPLTKQNKKLLICNVRNLYISKYYGQDWTVTMVQEIYPDTSHHHKVSIWNRNIVLCSLNATAW